jgi:hypothetical protein
MDADRFERTVTALRAVLRHIQELRKRDSSAVAISGRRLGR